MDNNGMERQLYLENKFGGKENAKKHINLFMKMD